MVYIRESDLMSLAVRRIAHAMGSAEAYIEFRDGSVYQFEPFDDADWFALNKPQVYPGSFWGAIISVRPDYAALRLDKWPEFIGSHAWIIEVRYS